MIATEEGIKQERLAILASNNLDITKVAKLYGAGAPFNREDEIHRCYRALDELNASLNQTSRVVVKSDYRPDNFITKELNTGLYFSRSYNFRSMAIGVSAIEAYRVVEHSSPRAEEVSVSHSSSHSQNLLEFDPLNPEKKIEEFLREISSSIVTYNFSETLTDKYGAQPAAVTAGRLVAARCIGLRSDFANTEQWQEPAFEGFKAVMGSVDRLKAILTSEERPAVGLRIDENGRSVNLAYSNPHMLRATADAFGLSEEDIETAADKKIGYISKMAAKIIYEMYDPKYNVVEHRVLD